MIAGGRCLPWDCPWYSIRWRYRYLVDQRRLQRRRWGYHVSSLSSFRNHNWNGVVMSKPRIVIKTLWKEIVCAGSNIWPVTATKNLPISTPFSWGASCRLTFCWPSWWRKSGPYRRRSSRKWPNNENPSPDWNWVILDSFLAKDEDSSSRKKSLV